MDLSSGGPSTAPSPQLFGQGSDVKMYDPAQEAQKQVAQAVVQQGARQAQDAARTGVSEMTAYVMENPTSLKIISFLIGLTLMVFSVLGVFNLFDAAFEPKEYLNNFYNIVFSVLICVINGKESWMESCFDIQNKVYRNCFLLATPVGRALFYFYAGSMTLLVLPHGAFWVVVYVILGSLLCVIGLLMLFLQYFGHLCGFEPFDSGLEPPSVENRSLSEPEARDPAPATGPDTI